MEQAPLLYCCDCKKSKSRDQFTLRTRNNKHGARGEPSSRCSSCAAKERDRNIIRKRKRDEEGHDSFGDPAESDHTASIEQFTALLREQALTGDICCSARVSTQELDGEDEICARIVGRVWEATGFRFTYRTKRIRANGDVQRVYECCQTTSSTNNREKRPPGQGKQSRNTRRMPRFPCNGLFYVTARNGYFECVLKHSLNHIPYKDRRVGPDSPTVSPLPMPPSPSRSHSTGVDSILRESDSSSVSQPLSRQEHYENLIANLEKARKLIESQRHQASLEWFENIKEQFKPGFEWVKDNLSHRLEI